MSNLPIPVYEETLDNYYYDAQFKKYFVQFMAIFSGLQVKIGKNDLGSASNLIKVPIKGASADRVVNAIFSDNTQNKLLRLPMMAAKITNIGIDVNAKHGSDTEYRKVYLPLGESLPDGLQVVRRVMPTPYLMTFELSIMSSNLDQQNQILEQICMLFDPMIQIQTSDKPFDWTKINTVTMEDLNLEENYPAGQDRRIMIATATFTTTVYLSAPANYRQDYIKSIQVRIDAIPTAADTQLVVRDINRPDPPYEKLFDIEDYDIPPL